MKMVVVSVRIIKTIKNGLEVYVLILAYFNGQTSISIHMSEQGAYGSLKRQCPYLDAKFFKVENSADT